MKILLTLSLTSLITNLFAQSPVTDFQYDINQLNCNRVSVQFYFEGSMQNDVDSCYWYFGDGVKKFSSSSNGASHSYSHPGIYGVELVLWKDGVESSIKKDSIITVFQPPTPLFNFEVSDTLLFAPLTVNFINNTQKGDGDTLAYNWEIWGHGTNYSVENPTVTFSNPGTYTVLLKVTDENACEYGYSDYVIVKDSAQRDEFPLNMSGCYGDSEIPPCGYDKHFEIIDDTLVISGFYYGNCGTTKTVTVNYAEDTVVVKIWETGPLTRCGCGSCFEIKVPDIYTDSVIVNFNNELKTGHITGIHEVKNNDFQMQVYPNPANEVLYVYGVELLSNHIHYEILDFSGVVRQKGILEKDFIDLKGNNFAIGYYILVIKTENEVYFSDKIFISND